jgi:hypothetical protein
VSSQAIILVGLVAVLLAFYAALAAIPRRNKILIAINIGLALVLIVVSWGKP